MEKWKWQVNRENEECRMGDGPTRDVVRPREVCPSRFQVQEGVDEEDHGQAGHQDSGLDQKLVRQPHQATCQQCRDEDVPRTTDAWVLFVFDGTCLMQQEQGGTTYRRPTPRPSSSKKNRRHFLEGRKNISALALHLTTTWA
jgi:hypothetical protein